MKVWRIRTADGQPIMFDESVQILPNGSHTEFNFTDESIAKKVLLMLSVDDPETKFVLIKTNVKLKDAAWVMDTKDVQDKIDEEKRTAKA